jgi:hypothetical protein
MAAAVRSGRRLALVVPDEANSPRRAADETRWRMAAASPGYGQPMLFPIKDRYGRRLAVAYGLFAGIAALIIAGVELCPKDRVFALYGPNLVAELLGILVTVLVVERLLVWQRERALTSIRSVALRRVRVYLNRLMHFVLFSYKAAAPPGSARLTAPDELLHAWSNWGRGLDFRKPYGPDGPARSWHQHGATTMQDFEEGTGRLLDRYLEVLGPDLPVAVEDVVDHPITQVLKHSNAIERFDLEYGLDIPRLSLLMTDSDNPKAAPLAVLAEKLRRLIRCYDCLAEEPFSLDERLYEDHISPAWASAQVARPQQPSDA